jgi:hypothetical protein
MAQLIITRRILVLHITSVEISKHNLGQDKIQHARDGNQILKVNGAAIALPVAIAGRFCPLWAVVLWRRCLEGFGRAPYGRFGQGALGSRFKWAMFCNHRLSIARIYGLVEGAQCV